MGGCVQGLVVVGRLVVLVPQVQGAHVPDGMVMSLTNWALATASTTAKQRKTPKISISLKISFLRNQNKKLKESAISDKSTS